MNGNDLCPRCGDVMAVHGNHAGAEVKCEFRDESDLTPQLVGLEGWRVEVRDSVPECEHHPYHSDPDCRSCIDAADANLHTRRFYVGRSTGWKPSHLEVNNRRSLGGAPAFKAYASVRRLYRR